MKVVGNSFARPGAEVFSQNRDVSAITVRLLQASRGTLCDRGTRCRSATYCANPSSGLGEEADASIAIDRFARLRAT